MDTSQGPNSSGYNFGVPVTQGYEGTGDESAAADTIAGDYPVLEGYSGLGSTEAGAPQVGLAATIHGGLDGAHHSDEGSAEENGDGETFAGEDHFGEESDSGMLFKLHPRRETEPTLDAPAETEPEMLLNLHPRRETENLLEERDLTSPSSAPPMHEAIGAYSHTQEPPYLDGAGVEDSYKDTGMLHAQAGEVSDGYNNLDESHGEGQFLADTLGAPSDDQEEDEGQEFFMGREDGTAGYDGEEEAPGASDQALEGNIEMYGAETLDRQEDTDDEQNEETNDGAMGDIASMLVEDEDVDMQLPTSARPTEDWDRPYRPTGGYVEDPTIEQVLKRETTTGHLTITEMPVGYFDEEYDLGSGPKEGEVITMRSEKGIKEAEAKSGRIIIGVAALLVLGAGGGLHAFAVTRSATRIMTFLWPVLVVCLLAIAYVTWGTGWSQAVAMQKSMNTRHNFLAVSKDGHSLKDHETVRWSEYSSRIRAIRTFAQSQGIEVLKASKTKKRPRTRTEKPKSDKLESVVVHKDETQKTGKPDGLFEQTSPVSTSQEGHTEDGLPVPIASIEAGYDDAATASPSRSGDALEGSPDHQGMDMHQVGEDGEPMFYDPSGATNTSQDHEGSPVSVGAGVAAGSAASGSPMEFSAAATAFNAGLIESESEGEFRPESQLDDGDHSTPVLNTASDVYAAQATPDVYTQATAEEGEHTTDSAQPDSIYHQEQAALEMDDYGANFAVKDEDEYGHSPQQSASVAANTHEAKHPGSNNDIAHEAVRVTGGTRGLPHNASMLEKHIVRKFPSVASKSRLALVQEGYPEVDGVDPYHGVYATGGQGREEEEERTMASTTVAEGSFMLHRTASDQEAMEAGGGLGGSQPAAEQRSKGEGGDVVTDFDTKKAMLHRSLYGSVFN